MEEFFEGEEFPLFMLRHLLGVYLLQAQHVGIQSLHSRPQHGQAVVHGHACFAAAVEILQIERGYAHAPIPAAGPAA
jgi:hypothetical protein